MTSKKLRHTLFPILYPLSLIYYLITFIRNKLYDANIFTSREFDFPVISVGNITAGGTGKTPHVEYLIRLLEGKINLAFLSRGYKRKTKGFVLADAKADPDSIGDEPYQVHKKFKSVKVAVHEKRLRGIEQLKEIDKDIQCVILDDAFQHRSVQPGVSILLIDYYRPLHKDHLLPLGDLRESRYGIHRANIVVVTKVPHEIKPIEKRLWLKELNLFPYQFLYFTSIGYGDLTPVFNALQDEISLESINAKDLSILLVTGIANPEPLKREMIRHCRHLDHLAFRDHYIYTSADLEKVFMRYKALPKEEKLIVTTEKDAVKLRSLTLHEEKIRDKIYYLPIKIIFLDNKGKEFDKNIYEFVAKNRQISRLYS